MYGYATAPFGDLALIDIKLQQHAHINTIREHRSVKNRSPLHPIVIHPIYLQTALDPWSVSAPLRHIAMLQNQLAVLAAVQAKVALMES